MTSSTAAPLVRAACPKCQTPDLIVNPSGSLRKHDCTPVEAQPVAEETAAATVADEVTPDGAGGASSFGADATAAGGTAPVEAAPEVEAAAPAPPAAPVEGRRYCRRENCGKRPVRHGWCAQDRATHCKGR